MKDIIYGSEIGGEDENPRKVNSRVLNIINTAK